MYHDDRIASLADSPKQAADHNKNRPKLPFTNPVTIHSIKRSARVAPVVSTPRSISVENSLSDSFDTDEESGKPSLPPRTDKTSTKPDHETSFRNPTLNDSDNQTKEPVRPVSSAFPVSDVKKIKKGTKNPQKVNSNNKNSISKESRTVTDHHTFEGEEFDPTLRDMRHSLSSGKLCLSAGKPHYKLTQPAKQNSFSNSKVRPSQSTSGLSSYASNHPRDSLLTSSHPSLSSNNQDSVSPRLVPDQPIKQSTDLSGLKDRLVHLSHQIALSGKARPDTSMPKSRHSIAELKRQSNFVPSSKIIRQSSLDASSRYVDGLPSRSNNSTLSSVGKESSASKYPVPSSSSKVFVDASHHSDLNDVVRNGVSRELSFPPSNKYNNKSVISVASAHHSVASAHHSVASAHHSVASAHHGVASAHHSNHSSNNSRLANRPATSTDVDISDESGRFGSRYQSVSHA